MNTNFVRKQAGFTLIELIVVIVILGILAATALPRMFDMAGQARIARMQAAVGAVRAASATGHATWLVAGGQFGCAACTPAVVGSLVTAEGQNIAMVGGFPDVGGDGDTNAQTATAGGMFVAANLDPAQYLLSTRGPAATDVAATNNNLSIAADAGHPNCRITYTEATQIAPATAGAAPTAGVAPVITTDLLTPQNCG